MPGVLPSVSNWTLALLGVTVTAPPETVAVIPGVHPQPTEPLPAPSVTLEFAVAGVQRGKRRSSR